MKTAIIIPARLASTRLPGKLLLDLDGKPVLQRTYEQAQKSTRADRVVIAADSEEIADCARGFGAEVVMTRAAHTSGTARIAEAAATLDAEIIVNIQGDEPEIDPAHIDKLIDLQAVAGTFASTLACPYPEDLSPDNQAAVKVLLGAPIKEAEDAYRAANFTRALPVGTSAPLYLHIGAYGFHRDNLIRFAHAPEAAREKSERLEQLRIFEMGETIAVRVVGEAAPGIDTPEDLIAAVKRAKQQRKQRD